MSASPALRASNRSLRQTTLLVVVFAVAVSIVGGWGAAPAEATSYRFWTYWTGGSDWTFSNQGAARRPADGAVEGWRFAISEASSSTVTPRHSPTFASLCRNTAAEDGKKRVGLVVDFGTAEDAPSGESPPAMLTRCAVVPEDANGYEVLLTAVQLRTDAGLICGMNGYPATECGEPVADPTPSPSNTSGGGGGAADNNGDGSSGDGGSSGPAGTNNPDSGSASSGSPTTNGEKKSDRKPGNTKSSAEGDQKQSAKPEDAATEGTDTTPAAAATSSPATPTNGSPVGLVVGLIVVVAIATAALVIRRKQRDAPSGGTG
jgi:uncharacterized membrane protein YgcG